MDLEQHLKNKVKVFNQNYTFLPEPFKLKLEKNKHCPDIPYCFTVVNEKTGDCHWVSKQMNIIAALNYIEGFREAALLAEGAVRWKKKGD